MAFYRSAKFGLHWHCGIGHTMVFILSRDLAMPHDQRVM